MTFALPDTDRSAYTVELIGAAGDTIKIYKVKAGKNEINIADLPTGNYIIHVYNHDRIYSGKITKQ